MDTISRKQVQTPDVYCHPMIKQVVALHAELLSVYPGNLRVLDVLEQQANVLWQQLEAKDEAICIQLSNWLPACVGMKPTDILKQDLTIHHMRLAVAREHGYATWEEALIDGNKPLDVNFEHAVDAILSGNVKKLVELLEATPALVNQRSDYGHKATLLIYLAANGVETWRQVVPSNADEIVSVLVSAGADIESTIEVYGGHHTFLELLLSSAHPREAGVLDTILQVLEEPHH